MATAVASAEPRREDAFAHPSGRRWGPWVASALVAAASLIAFRPALDNEFVHWDDYDNYVGNRHVRGLSGENLRWMATSNLMGVWQPLTWLVTAGEYAVFSGGDVRAFRRGMQWVSIALHVVVSVLVFFLVRRLLAAACPHLADESPPSLHVGSMIAALLYAVHPLRVETVAWASGQPYILATIPAIGCILFYMRAHESRRRAWHGAAVACLALSLLCKSIAVPTVAALFVLDVFPLRRIGGQAGWRWPAIRRIVLEKIPYVVVTAAAVALAIWATWSTKSYRPDPPLVKALIAAFCFAFYISLTFVPVGISPYYARPQPIGDVVGDPRFLAAAVGVIALTLAGLIYRRRAPGVLAAWTAYACFILPVAGLVKHGGQLAADRYTYLATIPFAALVGWAAAWLWRQDRSAAQRAVVRGSVAFAVFFLVVGLGAKTEAHCRTWHDSISLWTAMIDRNPTWQMGYYNLAKRYKATGDRKTALRLYRRAVELYPNYPEANVDLGNMLQDSGQLAEAIDHYQRALKGRRNFHMAHYNLARLLARQGKNAEALRHLELAEQDARRRDPSKLRMIRSLASRLRREANAGPGS